MYISLRSACDNTELTEIVWISVNKLAELWDEPDVKTYENPKENWFHPASNRECFFIPEIQIEFSDQFNVFFVNGRHRTKWLIQQGYKEIPVGILKSEIELGTRIGLIQRIFKEVDCLELAE
jgi:hypothetical protein